MVMNTLIPWQITFLEACFRGCLQSIPFLELVRNRGRTAKLPMLPAGNKAPRPHHSSSRAAGHMVGEKGADRACQIAVLALRQPFSMGFPGAGNQRWTEQKKKNPHICCCFVNYLKYYLGFTWNSLTTARFCWECQGKKLFYSPPLSEYILLECSSRDEGNYRLTRIVKWCQIASKSASF